MDTEIKTYCPMYKSDLVELWHDRPDTNVGLSMEQVLQSFREFRDNSRTCGRCDGTKYVKFCQAATMCEQSNEEEVDNENRSRIKVESVDIGNEPGQSLGGIEASFVSVS